MLGEWTGASVEPEDGKPAPDVWTPVDVPGRPPVFADADAVAYRTAFDDPRAPDEARAVLELRGLYAHADVWLNDEHVGSHDAYFRPFRHAFEPEDSNELVVLCRSPEDRFGGVHDTDLVPTEDSVPGIWWGVDLETHPERFVFDVDVRPHLIDDGAAIDVQVVVENGRDEPLDDRLTFSLRPEGDFQSRGMMDRASVAAPPGEQATVEHTIDVRDPSRWWPAELGPQHRYAVRAKLGDVTRSVTTGLCSITRDQEGVRVNGERLPLRGIAALDATPADVQRAAGANANLLRVRGHVASPAVYEACSEAGLLVWQDLPLVGPDPFDPERGRALAATLYATHGNHPSLAAVSVHGDPVELFPDPLGSGLLDRLRFRWRVWRASYDRGPAEAVAEALPDDRPVFPVVGPVGIDADAVALYPGWDYGEAADVDGLLDRYDVGDVVGEFGAGALGSESPEELAGFDRAKHDARAGDDPGASQRYQARVLKRVTETLRRRGATICTATALRDTGDAGLGVLERDGTEKTGYGALAASFEPVQATLAEPTAGSESPVVVINDAGESLSGRLRWQAGDATDETEVAVDAHERTTAASVSLPDDADAATLTLTIGDHAVENEYPL